jgi:class 3 adenylate cyclase/tetratricopeptide (TPR) repeat protein
VSTAESRDLELLAPYVPRLVLQWLETDRDATARTLDGTMVFVDVSGFTKLSERLARLGREGAEELAEAIGSSFAAILALAYANGGGLLKFGGDALLLWFQGEDHVARACRSAVWMRRTLREVGRLRTSGGQVTLRMSVGVHTGSFHFFLVGEAHRELLVTGPAATRTVEMEHEATAGQILVSPETASLLERTTLGAPTGSGILLSRAPEGPVGLPPEPRGTSDAGSVLPCLPVTIRERVLADVVTPEHRNVTVAFLRFRGTDALLAGPDASVTGDRLHELLTVVQRAAGAHGVTVLGSDIDADGGKVILAAGAPTTHGNDEERMLLTVRRILDAALPLPVQIGVHRGNVFAGDIGPDYRRTYTVMGDTVNLAARLMARADPGTAVVTPEVTDRSRTRFALAPLEPFTVKGKAKPIEAAELGTPQARAEAPRRDRPPMVGREAEMSALRSALDDARRGRGRLVEIVGEPGIGKSRLLEEITVEAGDLVSLPTACETYATSTAYHPFRSLLRRLLGVDDDAPDAEVLERLRSIVMTNAPALTPWLPLLATVADVPCDDTPETAALDERFRRDQLHEVLDGSLAAVLPTPTLLVFEDAHLMDEASASFMTHLTADLDGRPWLVIVTRREVETGFAAPDGATVLRPAPLDAEAAASLIEGDAGDARIPLHVMEALAARSGGNPLFLRELAAAVRGAGSPDELPDSVEALIAARIDQLPPEDRDLLRRASVLGERFPLSHLEALAGPLPDDLPRRLDGFLGVDDGHATFSHALVQETAYAALPFRLRRDLHGAAADAIARSLDDPREAAEVLSLHYTEAGRWRHAWRTSRLAAERAQAKFAHADAARFLERALRATRGVSTSPRSITETWEKLGTVRNELGSFDLAADAFATAARIETEPGRQASLTLKRAYSVYYRSRYRSALNLLARAERLLEDLRPRRRSHLLAPIMVARAIIRLDQGRTSEAERIVREAVAHARSGGNRSTLARAYFILDDVLWVRGRGSDAVYSADALRLYEELGDPAGQLKVLNNMGAFAYFRGEWSAAIELYERSYRMASDRGDRISAANGAYNLAEVLSDQGAWLEAEEPLEEAIRIWRAADMAVDLADGLRLLGRTYARQERYEEAHAALGEALGLVEDASLAAARARVELTLAECCALQGSAARATTLLDGVGAALGTEGGLNAPWFHRVAAWNLSLGGNTTVADRAFRRSLTAARAIGSDYEAAVTVRAWESTLGPGAAPEEELRAASTTLSRLGVRAIVDRPSLPQAQQA